MWLKRVEGLNSAGPSLVSAASTSPASTPTPGHTVVKRPVPTAEDTPPSGESARPAEDLPKARSPVTPRRRDGAPTEGVPVFHTPKILNRILLDELTTAADAAPSSPRDSESNRSLSSDFLSPTVTRRSRVRRSTTASTDEAAMIAAIRNLGHRAAKSNSSPSDDSTLAAMLTSVVNRVNMHTQDRRSL
jgi:hypothetical protein